jgi:hypothetical protein
MGAAPARALMCWSGSTSAFQKGFEAMSTFVNATTCPAPLAQRTRSNAAADSSRWPADRIDPAGTLASSP